MDPTIAVTPFPILVHSDIASPLIHALIRGDVAVGFDPGTRGVVVVDLAIRVRYTTAPTVTDTVPVPLEVAFVGVPAGVDALPIVANALLATALGYACFGRFQRGGVVAVGVGDPTIAVADAVAVHGGVAGPPVLARVRGFVAVGYDAFASGYVVVDIAVGVDVAAAPAVADTVPVLVQWAFRGVPDRVSALVIVACTGGSIRCAGRLEGGIGTIGIYASASAIADFIFYFILSASPVFKV